MKYLRRQLIDVYKRQHMAEPKELADKMNACMREQIRSFLTDGEEQ